MPLQGFPPRNGQLQCEGVGLEEIADAVGTPTYVYSANAIRENLRVYGRSLERIPHEIRYSVKANSSLAILALLHAEGASFDIVSGGELYRVLEAGGDPAKVVYSGVGKTHAEMRYALERGIGAFHCESSQELVALRRLAAEMDLPTNVGLRVNPDIDAKTHPYIATGLSEHKFGIPLVEAESMYREADSWSPLRFTSLSCHIGSQIFDMQVYQAAVRQMLALGQRLRQEGVPIETIDLGGGLGVGYRTHEPSASIETYGQMLSEAFEGTGFRLGLEPGRSIVGQAGVLLTRVLYRKAAERKTFLVTDGAMNDLLRPALYEAHHEVVPVRRNDGPLSQCDIVGPVCESGDFLATERELPPCEAGDLLAVATAGAYGFVQSSNYNSRPRAAEVLVDRDRFRVIRRRESKEDLVRGETV